LTGAFALGPHGFELLRAIDQHRSLAAAAYAVGWSYRHAWDYLRQAETLFGTRLVSVRAGKGQARGMELTPFGRDVRRVGGSLGAKTRAITLKALPSTRPSVRQQRVIVSHRASRAPRERADDSSTVIQTTRQLDPDGRGELSQSGRRRRADSK
jgi:molybdate transport system regulatory protein